MIRPNLGEICRKIMAELDQLRAAGIPDPDAISCLAAYYDNPEDPGSDGLRAKAVLEKTDMTDPRMGPPNPPNPTWNRPFG